MLMAIAVVAKYLALVLVLVFTHRWIHQYLNGVTWDKGQQFNYHPLFMIIGLVVLAGQGNKGGCVIGERAWMAGVLRLMDGWMDGWLVQAS